MSTIATSEALSRFIQNKTFEVEVGAVRPATLTKVEEFVAMLGENLPDTEVEAPDPQDFRRLVQSASKRWGPLRLKQLRAFVLGWLRWCLEDEGLIERMPRTGSLKTPKVVANPQETYTPAEIRTLFYELDPFGRSLLGLGLFAGLNCSDIEHLTPDGRGEWSRPPSLDEARRRDDGPQDLDVLAEPNAPAPWPVPTLHRPPDDPPDRGRPRRRRGSGDCGDGPLRRGRLAAHRPGLRRPDPRRRRPRVHRRAAPIHPESRPRLAPVTAP